MRKLLRSARNVALILAGLTVIGLATTIVANIVHSKLGAWSIAVIEIRNRSGTLVDEATATVCGHQLRAAGIGDGGAAAMRFRIDCRDGDLRIRLASGQVFGQDDLQLSFGERRHEIFTITADRIHHQAAPVGEADLAAGRR